MAKMVLVRKEVKCKNRIFGGRPWYIGTLCALIIGVFLPFVNGGVFLLNNSCIVMLDSVILQNPTEFANVFDEDFIMPECNGLPPIYLSTIAYSGMTFTFSVMFAGDLGSRMMDESILNQFNQRIRKQWKKLTYVCRLE